MTRKTYRILTLGGIGDVLLATPAFRALKQREPGCRITLYCQTKQVEALFKNNPHIHKVNSMTFWKHPISFILYKFKWAKFYTFLYGHMMPTVFARKNAKQLIADMLEVPLQDEKIDVYISQEEKQAAEELLAPYKNPILVHITSMTSENQEWPMENWNALAASMPEYTFIQVGLTREQKVENMVDWRGKTSFRETMALFYHIRSFVGVNSSFSHVTNAFDTPGVVLFGPSQPAIWGHSNNVNLYKPLRCSPCLDLLVKGKCPYGRECMHNITVDEVKEALLKQMSYA